MYAVQFLASHSGILPTWALEAAWKRLVQLKLPHKSRIRNVEFFWDVEKVVESLNKRNYTFKDVSRNLPFSQ